LKIAFTGAHGTGKTTSAFYYAYTAKLENPNFTVEVFHENASRAPKGLFNKSGTRESQMWIFTNQIRTEIELTSIYNILVCDRTCFDSIAYCIYLGFQDLADVMFELAMKHLPSYNKIMFKSIENNAFLFANKHRDTEDLYYQRAIEDILWKLYEKANIITADNFIRL